ncbi:MAG: hypothetical protein U0M05_07860 [Clostridia bacterium]|jgi:hypothetical protein|nr:hypothetical protein [Clostridia bacterium]
MEKQELKNKIKEFCENKHFENSFIQECITEFIEGHTELYGDVISAEDLFKRLEDNLDKITFAGREEAPNGELGEYKGRIADTTDTNEIFIYFDEADLDLSETDKKMWTLYTESDKQKLLQDMQTRRSEIKSTLIHELTHSAYTIKDEYGIGEKHIFSETGKDYFSGEYRQIGGNNNNIEAIVNYISSRIEGKNPDEISTYQAETKAIYMLAEKIDEKSIVQSAWVSDEQQFKQAYIESIWTDIETGEKSYNSFQNIMKKLVVTRGQNISIGENTKKNELLLSEMQQILDGKSYELESGKFKDMKHTTRTEDTISTDMPERENKLSLSQRIARFFEKHKPLMNISIVKNFVRRQLDVLPPARNQKENNASTLNSRRSDFINEISNNGEFRKLQPLQTTNERNQGLEEINKQISEENER